MREACVGCHNTHPDSPKTNWKAGDVRGILEVIQPLGHAVLETRKNLQGLLIVILILIGLGVATVTLVILSLRRNAGELERRVQNRTRELTKVNKDLDHLMNEHKMAVAKFRMVLEATPESIIMVSDSNRIVLVNTQTETLFTYTRSELLHMSICQLLPDWSGITHELRATEEAQPHRMTLTRETIAIRNGGEECPIEIRIVSLETPEERLLLASLWDITERKQLETQLSLAQKMESIGQLAAGIAHEINTPTQFVSDNLWFLIESFGEIQKVLNVYAQVIKALPRDAIDSQLLHAMDATLAEADLEYVCEEIPKALQQSLDGSERVGNIVRAMKEFSHPGTTEKKPIDLNHAIESTIAVSRNEWKYVAEVVTDLEPTLPFVPCLPGELNQVMLNLLVNAAHAIADAHGPESDGKGTITITTRRSEAGVEIRITDTGTGIPEAARTKIFDPFFTTKEVGKGTGQGLAIAHDVIVTKHGGDLTFETTVGTGTTFVIQLPCQPTAVMGVES